MKRKIKNFIAVVILLFVAHLECQALQADNLTGKWLGAFDLNGNQTAFNVEINVKDGQTTASLTIFTAEIFSAPIKDFKSNSGKVSFSISVNNQPILFEGAENQKKIQGSVKGNSGATGSFELIKLYDASQELLAEYAGNYQLAPDRIITLGPFDEPGGNLVSLDLKTRRQCIWQPISSTKFICGKSLGVNYPAEFNLVFKRDAADKIIGFDLEDILKKEKFAARKVFPHRTETVEFKNGDVTLRGNLMIPEGAGRHPAVVFAHPSGDATRNVGFFQTFFLNYGIAVLSFDKRGAGKSTGDWRTSSFDQLADDVVEGIKYLKARADIDPKQIGVQGSSQGGWIAPIVAVKEPDVAFIIVRAGPGVDVVRTVAREDGGFMRMDKLSPAQIQEGEDFVRRILYMVSRGEPWEKVNDLFLSIKDKPWRKSIFPSGLPKNKSWWTWFRLNGHYDSTDYLKKLKIPVLWFLGEFDQNLPTPESASAVRAALAEADNRDFQVIVLPRAGHAFLETDTGFNNEFPFQKYYVDGYWNVIGEWLKTRVKTSDLK